MTTNDLPYRDASLTVEQRVEDLLARMTLPEKLAQLGCVWSTQLVVDDGFSDERAAGLMADGTGHITRIAASTGLDAAGLASFGNTIQRWLVEETRLGIPAVIHEESTAGFCARGATQFPQAIGLAATWDTELMARIGDVIRTQMMAVGARHTLAPVLDIARDPRWGRVEETYGEDPELAGQMGVAYVTAVQAGGNPGDLRNGVVCTAKHFLAYGLSDGGLNHGPVQLGQRELREVFAEPFAAAIRHAGLASVMNSYASIDGLACAGSEAILTTLLRDELGFGGTVVADYFAVDLLRTHHRLSGDKRGAAVLALRAGLDIELPSSDCYGAPLREAVEQGEVGIELVDTSVRRALTQKFALGLFEEPYVDEAAASAPYESEAARGLARRAAAEAVVVLDNDGVLPLRDDLTRIAVVGPAADDIRLTQGDYHYPAHLEIIYGDGGADFLPRSGGAFAPGPYFPVTVTPLEAIRTAFPMANVNHARGCGVTEADDATTPADIDAAVDAARHAEVVVVCVGGRSGLLPTATVGEARDATDLSLTGRQTDLVEAVASTGTPTVVVVMSGRVHTLGREAAAANAIVLAWPGGEEAGSGLADVLTGSVDASGRLPVSLPRSVGQVPVHYNHRAGGGSSKFWGDYSDGPTSPLFAFGHGRSFTDFAYSGLDIRATTTAEPVAVSATVTNTGGRAGVETVQCYVRDEVASVARPDLQLVGFARVPLEVGGSAEVTFTVSPSKLAFFDASMSRVCEPGAFTFLVGPSSAELPLAGTVELIGERALYFQRLVRPTAVGIAR